MKKYTLPKEFAEKWVEALRSGEYKQDTVNGHLKHHDRYCCLGVACKMQGQRVFKDARWISVGVKDIVGLPKLPIGIPTQLIGCARDNELVSKLSRMNDDGKSFPEIADWITENVQFI